MELAFYSEYIIIEYICRLTMKNEATWFEDWFNTPFYAELYQNRSVEEAQFFLNHLMTYLNLPKTNQILDLACGEGRHSKYLHQLGYNVYGADISKVSIKIAKQFESEGLEFYLHDMREVFPKTVDAVVNLFTSFGYFDDMADNQQVIHNVARALSPKGILVIDYLNTQPVINQLPIEEIVKRPQHDFQISKYFKNNNIYKEISIDHNGNTRKFREQVAHFTQDDFSKMLKEANFSVLNWFGNYQLDGYNSTSSPRLIAIAQLND